jgi:hypothetical protein
VPFDASASEAVFKLHLLLESRLLRAGVNYRFHNRMKNIAAMPQTLQILWARGRLAGTAGACSVHAFAMRKTQSTLLDIYLF